MGVPLPNVEPSVGNWSMSNMMEAAQDRARLSAASAFADTRMLSLQQLLAVHAHPSVREQRALQAEPLSLSADDNFPLSPPPLAPPTDSDSDADEDTDMPALLPASPPSASGLADDACPWGLLEDEFMQEMPLLQHRRDNARNASTARPLPYSFATSRRLATTAMEGLFATAPRLHSRIGAAATFGPGRASTAGQQAQQRGHEGASGPQAPQTLEAELATMAGRLAQLVQQHRGTAHPGTLTGLQDAANLLQGLASGGGVPPQA